MTKVTVNLVAGVLLAGSIIVLAVLRLTFVPPSYFFEGDDAALAVGVARMCEKDEIGPYFMQPPPVQVTEGSAATEGVTVQAALASMPARFRYYRYSSMPGMYLLGKLTCSLGEAAPRLSWISFIAGTMYPLVLALFLIRLFGPFPGMALLICYVFIAISPELWVSGSAYSNDKIVALCFLVGALLVSLYSTRDEGKQHLALIALSGVLFGLAILMRLDTVLFLPAALLVVVGTGRTLKHSRLKVGKEAVSAVSPGARGILDSVTELVTPNSVTPSVVFLAAAGFVYAAGMRLGEASLSNAMSSVAHFTELDLSRGKAVILLSAIGWAQVLMLLVFAAAFVVLGIIRITRGHTSSPQGPSRWKFRVGEPLTYQPLVIGLLLVPELFYMVFFPFFSQKYVLMASTIISGMVGVIFLKLWQSLRSSTASQAAKRWSFLAILVPLSLVVLGGTLKLAVVPSGIDGRRAIGGHLSFRLYPQSASTTARELVDYLDQSADTFEGSVIILHPSWLFQQALAYESLLRGWSNDVVALPISRAMENRDHVNLQALDIVPTGSRVYLTLNRYVSRDGPNISIMVPSDIELIAHKDLFSDAVLRKAIPFRVYFLELTCSAESPQEYVYPNRFGLRLCSQ